MSNARTTTNQPFYNHVTNLTAIHVTYQPHVTNLTHVNNNSNQSPMTTPETLDSVPLAVPDLIFGVLGSLACCSGILLNLLAVPAFYKTVRHISNKFYLMMVITDIATSVSMVPFCVSRLYNCEAMLYDNVVVCNLAGVLFSLGSQLSVLSVALQSIVRTQSLLFPLRDLKLLPLKLFCIFYLTAQILIAALPFLVGMKYKYYSYVTSCNFSLRDKWSEDSLIYKVTLMLVGILPVLWPAIPILLSCFISVFILLVRDRNMGDETTNARCRHASVTIVLVTGLYIVLNIPYWNYLLYWLIDFESAASWFAENDPNTYFYTFLNPFSMLVNSGINPVIYLIRMKKVRENVLKLFRCHARKERTPEVVFNGTKLVSACPVEMDSVRRASVAVGSREAASLGEKRIRGRININNARLTSSVLIGVRCRTWKSKCARSNA